MITTGTARRKHAAYWFAVGVVEEQTRIWRGAMDSPAPVELAQEFSEYVEQKAEDYYAEKTWSMRSIPDQWTEFVKECHEFGQALAEV